MADKNAEILVRRSWTKGSGNLEQKAADDDGDGAVAGDDAGADAGGGAGDGDG